MLELLSKTKPQLDSAKDPCRLPSLVQDLHKVASLAEQFTEQRPRSNKSMSHLVDGLDQEGSANITLLGFM